MKNATSEDWVSAHVRCCGAKTKEIVWTHIEERVSGSRQPAGREEEQRGDFEKGMQSMETDGGRWLAEKRVRSRRWQNKSTEVVFLPVKRVALGCWQRESLEQTWNRTSSTVRRWDSVPPPHLPLLQGQARPLTVRLPPIGRRDFQPLSQLLQFLDDVAAAFGGAAHGGGGLQDVAHLGEELPEFGRWFHLCSVRSAPWKTDSCTFYPSMLKSAVWFEIERCWTDLILICGKPAQAKKSICAKNKVREEAERSWTYDI